MTKQYRPTMFHRFAECTLREATRNSEGELLGFLSDTKEVEYFPEEWFDLIAVVPVRYIGSKTEWGDL